MKRELRASVQLLEERGSVGRIVGLLLKRAALLATAPKYSRPGL